MTDGYRDAGVFDATAQKWLTRVAALPAAGQYTVDQAGLYQFSPAQGLHRLIVLDEARMLAETMAMGLLACECRR